MVELRSIRAPSRNADAGRDLVVLGGIDWESRRQRPQMLSAAMADRGWRVLYVDPTPYVVGRGIGTIVADDAGVICGRLQYRRVRREDPHLMRMDPAREGRFAAGIRSLTTRAGMDAPTVLMQHPYWLPVVRQLRPRVLVYDCMDLHRAFNDPHCAGFPQPERELIRDAHAVTVTSDGLRKLAERIRPCAVVRNACEAGPLAAVPAPPAGSRPLVMYIGAISWWFDAALVRSVARSMPEADFRLVGSTRGCDTSSLEGLANVRLEGEVSHDSLPGLLAQASVGIIPFRMNQLTRMTDPVKAYEYLAAGRPVVSSIPFDAPGLPASLVSMPLATADAWVKAIRTAIPVASDASAVAAARAFAAANTWAHRAEELERAIVAEPLTGT